MKKVFIVSGNHDGNIGVFTNVKLAYERAKFYCESNPDMSYAQTCKACKGWGCTMYSKDDDCVQATIQVMYLNA